MHTVNGEDGAEAQSTMDCSAKYLDDMSAQLLRDNLVHDAKAKGLNHCTDKGVDIFLSDYSLARRYGLRANHPHHIDKRASQKGDQ